MKLLHRLLRRDPDPRDGRPLLYQAILPADYRGDFATVPRAIGAEMCFYQRDRKTGVIRISYYGRHESPPSNNRGSALELPASDKEQNG